MKDMRMWQKYLSARFAVLGAPAQSAHEYSRISDWEEFRHFVEHADFEDKIRTRWCDYTHRRSRRAVADPRFTLHVEIQNVGIVSAFGPTNPILITVAGACEWNTNGTWSLRIHDDGKLLELFFSEEDYPVKKDGILRCVERHVPDLKRRFEDHRCVHSSALLPILRLRERQFVGILDDWIRLLVPRQRK